MLCSVRLLAAVLVLPISGARSADLPSVKLIPRVQDYTLMSWAEGFPGNLPEAPWHRLVQTGTYAFVQNTETLEIPHFGAVADGGGYAASVLDRSRPWEGLPPATLRLSLTVDGKDYRCTGAEAWSRYGGPRLIESGRFFQGADVTGLTLVADDGQALNVEARFETAAWPDRLALILAARPGVKAIAAGEASFGRVRGGFGLDGSNHLEIPHAPELDPEKFTLELWAFVPADYQASERVSPWLVCKNRNEVVEGNFGLMLARDGLKARMNIGGGKDNAVTLGVSTKASVRIDAWNHLAMSYDGDTLRLYLNGAWAGEMKIGKKRVPGRNGLAIGRRQDGSGDGYHFRGVVDEVRLYDRALALGELRQHYNAPEVERPKLKPVGEWTFDSAGTASMTKPRESWAVESMEITLSTTKSELKQVSKEPADGEGWQSVALALDPVGFAKAEHSPVRVRANEVATGAECPVGHDAALSWHRVNLDGIDPIVPEGRTKPSNDALERVRLMLSNPTDQEETARLMFEKSRGGIRQRIGTPITGVSAILRDKDGNPTGIPVQLSKNWHNEPEGGVYAGQWFHGISQVRLPAKAEVELELVIAYGHWGGVAAASHAQLSLIGWGSNQLWDQSAIGAWGESICYEPDQAQAESAITDVRPLMVRSMGEGKPWSWTANVGGGDFFRFFDPSGERLFSRSMRTAYHRQGPCLTEVTYAGQLGSGIRHSATVSLARSDDLIRGVYRLRMDVTEAMEFSRFVLFQIGADTYNSIVERKMALGNETGLLREWDTQWGGNAYRTEPMECVGRLPWISMHEAVARDNARGGAIANRGIVIRSWKARLGGKEAAPWVAERGLTRNKADSSTLDLVPTPGVMRLEPGDFVEATLEHILMPQFAADYYGPNEALRAALTKDEDTWRMIEREAVGNDRQVAVTTGTLTGSHPAITIATEADAAEFTLKGGLGHVPITFTGLSQSSGFTLTLDGQPVDQSVHGKDFWQTDYDASSKTWSQTFNVPMKTEGPKVVRFLRK